jgi:hypothetical protein
MKEKCKVPPFHVLLKNQIPSPTTRKKQRQRTNAHPDRAWNRHIYVCMMWRGFNGLGAPYVQVFYCVFVVFIVDLWTPRYKWGDCVRANRFNPATSCIRICACSKPTVPTQTILSFIYMFLQDFFMLSGSVVF